MTDWRKLYAQRNWDALDDMWRCCEDPEILSAFLIRLRSDVPKVRRQNGMEEQEDYGRPDEVGDEWKGAAEILYLGELAATVEGEPEPVSDEWYSKRREIAGLLGALVKADEVTSGDASLSRSAHANAALELLDNIDWCVSAMSNEIDPDGSKPEDREWLHALAGEIASLAFNAGIHARAAIGKKVESHAVRGKKVIDGAKQSGRHRSEKQSAERDEILAKMNDSIAEGHTVKAAANHAYKAGLGRSPEANRKRWTRHKK